jgi:hypothetical protein
MALIHHPPTIINAYLAAKVNPMFELDDSTTRLPELIDSNGNIVNPQKGTQAIGTTYFFPTMPTEIDALTETFPDSNGVFAVYDRMFKMRRQAFPHIKCEQLLYYFYSTGDDATTKMVITQQQISDLLDKADESAQDINRWARENESLWSAESKPVSFHSFKIYQLEETRDIVDFGTARTYAGNKIIIDYDWHKA